ncbi:MAG TPA: amidohydrolase family protein [Thermoplasmata archaeon]|nr:amidohydrolase family protein [Thermoplasmata archaeon]
MPVRRGSRPHGDRRSASETFSQVVAGRAWIGGGLVPVEVGIDDDGKIGRVARSVRSGGQRLDLGESVLLPSATDLHVHFRDPGGPDPAETFSTGTEGAALGGIGTVVDMPNTEPAVTDRDRWESKAARTRGSLAVDVVLFGFASSPAAIRSLAPVAGGLKLYLSPTTGGEEGFAERDLAGVLEAAAASGLALSVHAERPAEFRSGAVPPRSSEEWNWARPPAAESSAVERVMSAAPTGLRLHIAHATLPSTVDRIAAAHLSCEATPHHLLLSEGSDPGAWTKTNPPLRSESDRRELWQRFYDGKVPILASDHAPHHRALKELPFDRAPSGVPAVETMVPIFLELVRTGRLALPVLMAAVMDRPARWLGLPLGRLAPGHRANFIAVDFRRRRDVAARRLRSPSGWSPFEGRPAVFPTWHFLDGRPIVEDGEFVGHAAGRIVRPEYARDGPIPLGAASSA